MDDPFAVCGGDGLADLEEGGQEAWQVGCDILTERQDVLEGLAGEQLHHDERLPLVGQVELVDRDDAGMPELAGEPRLPEKPEQPDGPGLLFPVHQFDGHAPLQLGVPPLEDDAHAATTDLPADEIPMTGSEGLTDVIAAGWFVLPATQQGPKPFADPFLAEG